MTDGRCPSSEILAAYLEGSLPASQRDLVAEHVASCDVCALALRAHGDTPGRLPETAAYSDAAARGEAEDGAFTLEPESPYGATATIDAGLGFVRDYRLLEMLGQGGMGVVYKAVHTQLERIVALKLVSPERCQDAQTLARFRREIKAAGKLNHPNIITAYDAGESAGKYYLVMEYVDGVDLGTLTRRLGCLAIPDACELARQTALALKHIHKHGLIHRDIKPSNLMLTSQGRVKVLDLGLALLQSAGDQFGELTNQGGMMGTIDYMAPEQLDDSHGVDIRADIYSLGATLYKLLCGHAPYAGLRYTTLVQRINALNCKPFPPLRARRPQVSKELADVVQRMLRRKPADRYATPAEVVAALEPFTAGAQLLEHCGQVFGDTQPCDSSTLELHRQSEESEADAAREAGPSEVACQEAAGPAGQTHEVAPPGPSSEESPAAVPEDVQAAREWMAKLGSDNAEEFRKCFDLDVIRRHGKLPEPYHGQLVRLIQEEILPLDKLGLKLFPLKSQGLTRGPHDSYHARWTWPDRRFTDHCFVGVCRKPPAQGESPREVALPGSLQAVSREQFEGGGCLVIHPRSEWDAGYVVVWALVDVGFQSFSSEPLVLGRLQLKRPGPWPAGRRGGL